MKYFFFDIDGTLTDIHTGILVPSALETLRKLEENGHFVAIATGRAYYKTIKAAADAGIHNLVSNGGAALVINDQIVRNSPLDKEKAPCYHMPKPKTKGEYPPTKQTASRGRCERGVGGGGEWSFRGQTERGASP